MKQFFFGALFALAAALSMGAKAAPSLAPDYWSLIGLQQCTNGLYARVCPPSISPEVDSDGPGDSPLVDYWAGEYTGSYLDVSDKGFLDLPEPTSEDSTFYVSSSLGDDDNTCLTVVSPCKTLSGAGDKARDGYSDRILLKRGDVWTEEYITSAMKNGRSPSEPMILSYYGEGPRPRLSNHENDWIPNEGGMTRQNVVVRGLNLHAPAYDRESPLFNAAAETRAETLKMLGLWANITYEDNYFQHVELTAENYPSENRPQNITFYRNIFFEHYAPSSNTSGNPRPSFIYVSGSDGINLIENFFDYGGWTPDVGPQTVQTSEGPVEITGAGPNTWNHNVYINYNNTDVKLLRNVSIRGAANALKNRSGGVMNGNLISDSPMGLQIYGYTYDKQPHPVDSQVWDNVIINGVPMDRNDPERYPMTSTAIYGMTIWPNITVDYSIDLKRNIVANSLAPGYSKTEDAWGYMGQTGPTPYTSAYEIEEVIWGTGDDKNILYKWDDANHGTETTYSDPDRDITSYMQVNGFGESLDDFSEIHRARGPGQWSAAIQAPAINEYVRTGFNITAPITFTPFTGVSQ